MQHAEERHQTELAERRVRRQIENVALLKAAVHSGQRGARPLQQRGAAVEANIAQAVFADSLRQERAEAPVAAANIQNGERRVEIWQKPLPPRPRLLPSRVEVDGDGFIKAPVEVVQIAKGRVVHNFPYNVPNRLLHRQGLYMHTTLKRIDVATAFRVGFVVYALIFAIFGLIFVLLQGLLLSGMAGLASDSSNRGDFGIFFGAGILGLLCFYGVGIIAAAVGGGIQLALGAFFYNLAANWIGGIKIELETDESRFTLDDIEREMNKRKRDEL